MVATTASAAPILSPQQVSDLLVKPLARQSVAGQVSKVVTTGRSSYRIPMVNQDPNAGWVAEGAEYVPSDIAFGEDVVRFAKLGGLTIVTREAAADTSPEAVEEVGNGLVRDLVRKLDAAFFGDVASPAPDGLDALPSPTSVNAGSTWSNLDAFAEAQAAMENRGVELAFLVTNSATALTLAQIKAGTGSNVPLLTNDPAQPSRRLVQGVPLLVSPYVKANTVWGIPKDLIHLVIREDARIETSKDVFFTSDRIAVKASLRVGWAFAYPEAIVKITRATS